jgi:hypothetical protein
MQLTLTADGLAAANYANTQGLTITIDKFRVYRSPTPVVSLPYVPTGTETQTLLDTWTRLPTPSSEFATVEEFEPLDADTVQFSCVLDETVGDFAYDVIAVYLDDGTLFGLAGYPIEVWKFQTGTDGANKINTHLSFTFTNAATVVNINIDNSRYTFDYVPEVNNVKDIPAAAVAPHRIYRCTRTQGNAGSGVRSFLVQSGKAFFDPQSYHSNEWIPSDHRLIFKEADSLVIADHPSNANYQNTATRVVLNTSDPNNVFRLLQLVRNDVRTVVLSFFEDGHPTSGLLRHVSSVSNIQDVGGTWIRLNIADALPAPASVSQKVKLYTSQMDYVIPLPGAKDLVLTSIEAPDTDNGFAFSWKVRPIVTMPFACDVQLRTWFQADPTKIGIYPINGGVVVIQGTPYVLAAPIQFAVSSIPANDVPCAVYLHAVGGVLQHTLEAMPAGGTNAVYATADGIAVRRSGGVLMPDYLFIGVVYKNTILDPNVYANIASVYSRSFYHDMGTTGAGYAEPTKRWDAPYFYSRELGPQIARMRSPSVLAGNGSNWGPGVNANDLPHNGITYASNCTVPPSTNLVLGALTFPYEQLVIDAQFDAYVDNTGTGVCGVRNWNMTLVRANPPGAGNPVPSAHLQTVLLEFSVLTNAVSGSAASYGRTTETVRPTWHAEGGFGDNYIPQFEVFDMVWNSNLYVYGESAPSSTRMRIEHDRINRNLLTILTL